MPKEKRPVETGRFLCIGSDVVCCVVAAPDGFHNAGSPFAGAVACVNHRNCHTGHIQHILSGTDSHDHHIAIDGDLLLALQGAGTLDNLYVGAGDLYVTVYGGRTRLIGILLGRGLDIDEARAQLNGVTLESLTVATRVARAVKARAAAGEVDLADYPLLMHIDDILQKHAPVDIPWEQFTFVKA